MKTLFHTSILFAGALALAACGSNDAGADDASAEGGAEVAAADAPKVEECNQDSMMAKATEVGEKMQAMAGDPAKMQEMAKKMQEIQGKFQAGSADGSFGLAEACAAYDDLLATAG